MPPRGADPADKRSSPLRSHPPALPLAKRPEEHQKPSEVESGAELLGRFPFRCSSPINFKGLRTSDAEDTASDSDKNNSAFGLKRQVYSNSDVLDETVHSSMSESPEFESKLVAPIDQGKWDLPNSSLAEESKDEAKPLVGLGILGLESKVSNELTFMLSLTATPKNRMVRLTAFQGYVFPRRVSPHDSIPGGDRGEPDQSHQ